MADNTVKNARKKILACLDEGVRHLKNSSYKRLRQNLRTTLLDAFDGEGDLETRLGRMMAAYPKWHDAQRCRELLAGSKTALEHTIARIRKTSTHEKPAG